jgi:hypothetical protein
MDPYLARQCQIERLRETHIPILQGKFAINILLCRFPQLSSAVISVITSESFSTKRSTTAGSAERSGFYFLTEISPFELVGRHFANMRGRLGPELSGYHGQIIWISKIYLKGVIAKPQNFRSGQVFRR